MCDFKSAPVSALAVAATLPYWEVLSDSPVLFAQENERLDREGIMENAFQLQGWNIEASEVLAETLILHGTGGRAFCSPPAVKIHLVPCT